MRLRERGRLHSTLTSFACGSQGMGQQGAALRGLVSNWRARLCRASSFLPKSNRKNGVSYSQRSTSAGSTHGPPRGPLKSLYKFEPKVWVCDDIPLPTLPSTPQLRPRCPHTPHTPSATPASIHQTEARIVPQAAQRPAGSSTTQPQPQPSPDTPADRPPVASRSARSAFSVPLIPLLFG